MPDLPSELRQLNDHIAALENSRGQLPDDVVDTAIAAIRAQLQTIVQAAHAVAVTGNNYGNINTGLIIQQASKPGAGKGELRRAYLARILNQANQLALFAGDSANTQIRLSSVYTALLTQHGEWDARLANESGDDKLRTGRNGARQSVLDRFNAERKLVLLGGPGSGKSTFINFVALCMAGEMLGSTSVNLDMLTAPIPPEPDSTDDKPKTQQWDRGALLPVPVVLRDFASDLPGNAAVNAATLWQHIEKRLHQSALGDFAPYLKQELLESGGLILLDGLDEVPDPEARREQIKQAVRDFADTFDKCRFLATSRTYAYTRQDWKLHEFAEAALLPFSPGQIQRFVDAWYAHMSELSRLSENDAKGRAELLKRTIAHNDRLAELAERPLLLTLIARLHTERGGALPEKREELYAQAVELLLNQWESLKVSYKPDGSKQIEPSLSEWLNASRDDIRRELDKLAFEAHRDQADLLGTADIRQDKLVMALWNATPNKTGINLKLLEEYLRDRAGLLAGHGVGLYQFPHRTFQEYMAACHLTVDGFPDQLSRLLCVDPTRWREATLLAAAKVMRGTPEAVWSLADALCPCDEPPTHGQAKESDCWGALLAGQVLWETGLAEPSPDTASRNEQKRQRVRRWLQAIAERGWLPTVDRAIAGGTLSVLGDGRDLEKLVAIPAGEFLMGDDGMDDSKPRHRVTLPAFKIGQYPVTNGQYRRFAQATQRTWDSPDADKPEKRNHPAVNVTWHDALAYCAWLTVEWRKAGKIGAGETVTLPSEAEWERAAAGMEGLAFPWGSDWREDCANTSESGIGDTSAVGIFPLGVSSDACLDIAGNVWEWTRSLWGKDFMKPDFKYPYRPGDPEREDLQSGDEIRRVVRGGSWNCAQVYARCAVRYWLLPDGRYNNLGFRVVLLCSAPVL